MKIEEIMKAIDDESGVDDGSIPYVRNVGWFPPWSSWEVGKPSPQNQGLGIIAIFSVEGEWHVFAIPITNNKPPPLTRYVLSKSGPCWSADTIPSAGESGYDLLIEEVAAERAAAAGLDDDSNETIECPKCHFDIPSDACFCPDCGEKVPDETPEVAQAANGNAEAPPPPPPAP